MMKNVIFLRLFVNKSLPLTNVISKCHYNLPPKDGFSKRYECNLCGQPFSSMGALENHIFSKHPEPTPLTNVISKYILPPKYECSVCGEGFNSMRDLQIHKFKYHAPLKPRLTPGKIQKKKITSSDSWTVVGYSTAEHYNLLALSEKILNQVHA